MTTTLPENVYRTLDSRLSHESIRHYGDHIEIDTPRLSPDALDALHEIRHKHPVKISMEPVRGFGPDDEEESIIMVTVRGMSDEEIDARAESEAAREAERRGEQALEENRRV